MRGHDGGIRALLGLGPALAFLGSALLVGSACVPETVSTVQGRIVLEELAEVPGAGSAAPDTAAGVRVIELGYRGTLTTLGSATVGEDGGFTLQVPAERTHLVVEAFSAQGKVLASALLEHSGEGGETVSCTPLDARSSLEAALFLIMATRAKTAEEVNVVDLRSRVTSRMASALREKEREGEDTGDDLRRLAEALLAAQDAELRAYGGAGVELSQEKLFELELPASRALSAALFSLDEAGDEGEHAAEAYETFHAALAEATAELGLSDGTLARAESSASLAFRLVVDRRVRADGSASQEVRDSALLAAAANEARAYEAATLSLLEAARVDEALRKKGEDAVRALRTSLALASERAEAAEAFGDFSTTLVGESELSGSLLEGLLGLEASASPLVAEALLDSDRATADLEKVLVSLGERARTAPGDIDVRAFAIEVTRAYAAHHDALKRAGASLSSVVGDAEQALGLIVLAESAYRLGE